MVERIYHVGLTVSDLDRSIAFYRDILGLEFQGEIFMAGEETDRLFRMKDTKARVAYLNGSKAIEAPPIELIQFVDNKVKKVKGNLFTTSISEVCFYTDDIERVYNSLIENHVECLSEPQYFDFRANELGESRAFYFRDPDGIVLEMMQPILKIKPNWGKCPLSAIQPITGICHSYTSSVTLSLILRVTCPSCLTSFLAKQKTVYLLCRVNGQG